MELKSWCMKSEQNGPAILSISVALPVDNERLFISVVVMGASLSKEVWAGVGGLLKYWEHENCDSGGLSLGDFSLYRSLKKVVSLSIFTC